MTHLQSAPEPELVSALIVFNEFAAGASPQSSRLRRAIAKITTGEEACCAHRRNSSSGAQAVAAVRQGSCPLGQSSQSSSSVAANGSTIAQADNVDQTTATAYCGSTNQYSFVM